MRPTEEDIKRKIFNLAGHGFTQIEISKELNVSQATISRVLGEKRPQNTEEAESNSNHSNLLQYEPEPQPPVTEYQKLPDYTKFNVLAYASKGASSSEIALVFGISEETVGKILQAPQYYKNQPEYCKPGYLRVFDEYQKDQRPQNELPKQQLPEQPYYIDLYAKRLGLTK